MLNLFKTQLDYNTKKLNNIIGKNENKNNNTVFLAKFKNLFKFMSIKSIKKPNFLISNIKEALNLFKINIYLNSNLLIF